MIPRYEVKEITTIWSDQNRFETFLKVEMALLRALEEFQIIPKETFKAFSKVSINPERIEEIEKTTRHDVIAFCTSITEQVGANEAKFFHYGVTSSDILDTALNLQIKASLEVLIPKIEKLLATLKEKILETKDILSTGRSHGMNAEPMIFAQKFLNFHQEITRRLNDYKNSLNLEITGQFSGAVGNYTILTPEIEDLALSYLNLKSENCSSQVINRDHVAKIVSHGVQLASSLERLATELRLLHHSDIAEINEGFTKGQKGSSTMPHKKNPISSENIAGLARFVKSHYSMSLENNVLWHERDISHSSNERLYLPDHFGILCYITDRMQSTIKDLVIHKEKIEEKALNQYTALTSYLMHEMLKINNESREEIYAFIQEASFNSKNENDFNTWIQAEAKKKNLKLPELISVRDLKRHYQNQFEKILIRSSLK